MWSGSANTHDRLGFRCQSVVWFLTLWPGTVPSLVTGYLPETGTSCREGGERQIQDGGGNRFLDDGSNSRVFKSEHRACSRNSRKWPFRLN